MKTHIYLIIPALLIAGCATKVTITGNSYPPTEPETIKVFAQERPDCSLEELGLIVTNLKWNQERAIKDAKLRASELGATHIQITEVERNIYNDAAVTAVAFRCKDHKN